MLEALGHSDQQTPSHSQQRQQPESQPQPHTQPTHEENGLESNANLFYNNYGNMDGDVVTWGVAICGRLGIGDTSHLPLKCGEQYKAVPTVVDALRSQKIVQIVCGAKHSMGLTQDGRIYTWGRAHFGRLGIEDTSSLPKDDDGRSYQPYPVEIQIRNKIIQIACSDFQSMCVTTNGELYVWGGAYGGRLGLGDTSKLPKDHNGDPFQPIPARVVGLVDHKVVQVACSSYHSLCVTEKGKMFSWGGACIGRLGLADVSKLPLDNNGDPIVDSPTPVDGLNSHFVVQVVCSTYHSLCATSHGRVFAWGGARYGRLGLGNLAELSLDDDGDPYQPIPALVDTLNAHCIVQVACSEFHNICVTREGKLFSWGNGQFGVLGIGDHSRLPRDVDGDPFQATPVMIEALGAHRVTQVACGEMHSLCVTSEGKVFGWGGRDFVPATLEETGDVLTPLAVDILADYVVHRVATHSSYDYPCYMFAIVRPALGVASLQTDMANLLRNEKNADVIFSVQGVEIPAHRVILSARSKYFEAMFESGMMESNSKRCVVSIQDCPPNAFRCILEWIYTGNTAPTMSAQCVVDVICAADMFGLEELKQACEDVLARSLTLPDAFDTWSLAKRTNAARLQACCTRMILEKYTEARMMPAFQKLKRENHEFTIEILDGLQSPVSVSKKRRRNSTSTL